MMVLDKSEFKKFEVTIFKTWKSDPRPYLFFTK
jgi:hypothetical protein